MICEVERNLITIADNFTYTKNCSKCYKHFQLSFFMNLEECGHIICKVCIYDWNNTISNLTCPVCKSSISERQNNIISSCIQHRNDLKNDASYEKIYCSSGGILFHEVNGSLLYLAVQQRRHNGNLHWVSPKGQIENNESSLDAAQREIFEETGLKSITLIDFISKQSYSYEESDKLYKKTVFWYLFNVNQPGELVLNKEEGFIKEKWLTYEEAINTFSYEDFIEIIKLVDMVFKKS